MTVKIKKDVRYKTNSYTPKPWALTEEPFRAFRGEGQRHRAFLAIHQSVADPLTDPTRLITTKAKGTLLLVPARPEQDERIALVMTRSGFRGWISKIEKHNVEVIKEWSSSKHCVEVVHLIVRFTDPHDSWIAFHYGRRCGSGKVDVFRWDQDEPDEYTLAEWEALDAMDVELDEDETARA